ncbi:MAG: Flp pilus assembly complex ATPase component TadA [Planctomycetia bacterium]|nr:Flp pilus assembly complex ATPase component TadA [Planctomycetia bacterium]
MYRVDASLNDEVPLNGDFTKYVTLNVARSLAEQLGIALAASHEFLLRITDLRDPARWVVGRAIMCRCSCEKPYSLTLRVLARAKVVRRAQPPGASPSPHNGKLESGWLDHNERKGPISTPAICDALFEALKPEAGGGIEEHHGLILVAGPTNSAKSYIARGLSHLYLEKIWQSQSTRRPHLVTVEDPPEVPFPKPGMPLEIDYTPRRLGPAYDVPSVHQAIHDALRQTPSLLYVGETRDDSDWKHLLKFAGHGHLLVTTAHAGSLVEAIERVLVAGRALQSARLAFVAQRLLAVIHLQPIAVGCERPAILPAIWCRKKGGAQGLVADGPASVLPHHSREQLDKYSAGRFWFLSRLMQCEDSLYERLRGKAVDLDIRGV